MSPSSPPPPAPEGADDPAPEEETPPPQPIPIFSKPRTQFYRPELTRLPRLSAGRKWFRRLLNALARLLVFLCTRCRVSGVEYFPAQGPALVVVNHLGDADSVMGMAFFPRQVEALAKIDLIHYPVLGWVMDAYGVIWVHRGQPDRKAIREALRGLKEGRVIGVAPEGRESVTGSLEKGTGGASFLALKTGVPIVPVTFTGTENRRIYGNLIHLRRTPVTMTFGPAFRLEQLPDRKQSIDQGTELIMRVLAAQLPAQYRGVYQDEAGVESRKNGPA